MIPSPAKIGLYSDGYSFKEYPSLTETDVQRLIPDLHLPVHDFTIFTPAQGGDWKDWLKDDIMIPFWNVTPALLDLVIEMDPTPEKLNALEPWVEFVLSAPGMTTNDALVFIKNEIPLEWAKAHLESHPDDRYNLLSNIDQDNVWEQREFLYLSLPVIKLALGRFSGISERFLGRKYTKKNNFNNLACSITEIPKMSFWERAFQETPRKLEFPEIVSELKRLADAEKRIGFTDGLSRIL